MDESRDILKEVIKEVQEKHPFEIKAWVLLPDHLHHLWELPEGDVNYSMRWALIKKEFTKRIKIELATRTTKSRLRHREGTVWQRRFWEHTIKDEEDYRAHVDYIHYNPVKHGLVETVRDWKYSSFHRYVKEGHYDEGWAIGENEIPKNVGDE